MNSLETIDGASSFVEQLRTELEPLAIDSGTTFDRLKNVFLIAVQQEPKILQCTPESLRREISKCAADGLVPDAREAVLLPYFDNTNKVWLANYQPMVAGIIKRLKELGNVFSIVCNLVYEKDKFELDESNPDSLSHISDRFSTDRGKIVGGYAVFRDHHKRVMHLETMSLEDFVNVRNASKAPNSPAWNKWTSEMYRKAVLRRGSKYIAVNNEKIKQIIERVDDLYEFSNTRVVERIDPFTGRAIDAGANQTVAITDARGVNAMPMATVDNQKTEVTEPGIQSDKTVEVEQQKTATLKEPKPKTKKNAATQSAVNLPSSPPSVPDVLIDAKDKDIIVECCEKVLAIPLDVSIEAADRRVTLKTVPENWKPRLPPYAHELLKACIEMADLAIRKDAKGEAWMGDHATFVHKVKTLLAVEKLNIGKYP